MNSKRSEAAIAHRRADRNARSRSWLSSPFSILIRLGVWYSIVTVLVRCPSSTNDLSDSSARICGPYLDLKSRVTPYTAPYYAAYAEPYVEKTRPYVAAFDANVYTPVTDFARTQYDRHGAAHMARAQTYGQQEWDRQARPRLLGARKTVSDAYEYYLAPHVDQAYTAVSPRVRQARAAGVDQYETVVVPTYNKAQPYLQRSYNRSYHFATDICLPYISWFLESAVGFIQRKVWPPIQILYGENVLPQLVKIKERLASYRDGKRLENIMHAPASSASSPSEASESRPLKSIISSSAPTAATASNLSASASSLVSTSLSPSATAQRQARQVSEDLKIWQAKFAKAADKGAEDLRERIATIAKEQIASQAEGTGEALLVSLEETTKGAIERLKPEVQGLVASLPKEPEALSEEVEQKANDDARSHVRAAGRKVKDAAERLRAWRRDYDSNTESLVTAASDSVLEVVDNIRDLGLQEIGMRWASMDDGVSYKDWSEYHTMRKTFAEWRSTVQSVVSDHTGPAQAKKAGEDIESRGMAIAEDAAKELARLKEVAIWKLDARDATDDFSTRYAPPGAARAAQNFKDRASAVSQSVVRSIQGTVESVASEASSRANAAAAAVSNEVDSASSSVSSIASSVIPKLGDKSSKTAASASAYSSAPCHKASVTIGARGQSETLVSLATVGAKSVSSSLASKLQFASSSGAEAVKGVKNDEYEENQEL